MAERRLEDSQSIAEWGKVTFGEASSEALALRACAELDELLDAIRAGEPLHDIAMEAADVTILLHRLTGDMGKDLSDVVNDKMAINRKRQWMKSGDGTGQHK
jgi:NTP pyrophosphatase (non-canonical NTP hydrolase)